MDSNEKIMNHMIEEAKKTVIKNYGKTIEREWIEARAYNQYKYRNYDIVLFMRTGSPSKGYVIANYGTRTVLAISNQNKILSKRSMNSYNLDPFDGKVYKRKI